MEEFIISGIVLSVLFLISKNRNNKRTGVIIDPPIKNTPLSSTINLSSEVEDIEEVEEYESEIDIDVDLYRKRYQLMNSSEASFFFLMQKYLPENYFIFPKMRIADIIETMDGKGYYKQRNKILPKHVDFVICDKNLKTVCAIEIDGKSHDTQKMQERDEQVEYIFESVGIPLERVRVGDDFEAIVREIVKYIEKYV